MVNGKRIEIGTVEVQEDGTVFGSFDLDSVRVEEVPGLRKLLEPDLEHLSIAVKEDHSDFAIPGLPLPQRIPGQFSSLFHKPQDKDN